MSARRVLIKKLVASDMSLATMFHRKTVDVVRKGFAKTKIAIQRKRL